MKRFVKAALAGTLSLAAALPALADDYRIAIWQPDNEPNAVVARWFAEEAAKVTNGALSFQVFSGAVLVPPKAMLQSVGDGVVQMGMHTSGYTPSEAPMSNALSGFGFIEPDPTTIALAYTDWTMTSKLGQSEFLEHNVVPFGAFSTPLYPILCNTSEPVTTLDQLKGKKIRFGGGQPAKLAQDLGIVTVNIPASEIYQALQTGQIDCASILAALLNIDSSLDEVTKSVTLLDWMGSFNSPMHLYNRDFWTDLTTEQRKTLFALEAQAQAKLQILFLKNNTLALERAAAKGLKIVKPDASITDAVAKWVDGGVGDMAGVAKATYGIADPQALFESFTPYVEKWRKIMAGVTDKMDETQMTKVIYDNIYAHLDPATYGIE